MSVEQWKLLQHIVETTGTFNPIGGPIPVSGITGFKVTTVFLESDQEGAMAIEQLHHRSTECIHITMDHRIDLLALHILQGGLEVPKILFEVFH